MVAFAWRERWPVRRARGERSAGGFRSAVHRSGRGLGAGDLLWWPVSTYDRAEIVRRLRHVPLATSFRGAYAYDNVRHLVAGQLIERVPGRPWEAFVRERILAPVGMTGSAVRQSDAAAGAVANVATSHAVVDGRTRSVAPMTSDNTNPAGGVNSTAADMARWMLVQLDSGRTATGARLFTPASARQLWTTVTPLPAPAGAPFGLDHLRPRYRGYALGFFTSDYRSRYQLQRSGGLPGYVSLVTMIPDARLGIAVLTNAESGEAFTARTLALEDALLGVRDAPDYVALYKRLADSTRADDAAAVRTATAARDSASHPSLPLARYAGTYRDAWYGDVDIAEENGHLVMRFSHTPQLVADLQPWQHDSFVARWRDRELRADAYVAFALTADGRVDQVRMAPASPDVDFSFDVQDLLLEPVPAAARARRRPRQPFSASSSAPHASVAQRMRAGKRDTPCSARSSPSDLSRAASASPCASATKRRTSASASSRVFPFTSCVSIDADACEIEQPWPVNFASRTTSPSSASWSAISSPHSGLRRSAARSGASSAPLLRGRR